jgi:phosphomannomutase/phosphoglucomutase
MKRRTNELGALAGFEKSGHFFFNKPFGRGYDDGLISAIAICEMLDRASGKSMADLKNALPKTWSSRRCRHIARTKPNTASSTAW